MGQAKAYILNDLNDFVFGEAQPSPAKPILKVGKYLKATSPSCNPSLMDFDTSESIGPNEKSYTSLIVGNNSSTTHEIKDQQLHDLAEMLLKMKLWVNCEGFCYFDAKQGKPDPSVAKNITNFYKINDLFNWDAYGVKIPTTFNSVWNSCLVGGSQTMIDYKKLGDDLKDCQTLVADKDNEIKNKDAEIKTKDDEITRLNDEKTKKDNEIASLKQQLAQCVAQSSLTPLEIVELRSVPVPDQDIRFRVNHNFWNIPISTVPVQKLNPVDVSIDPNFRASIGTIEVAPRTALHTFRWKLLMVAEQKDRPIAYYHNRHGGPMYFGPENACIEGVPYTRGTDWPGTTPMPFMSSSNPNFKIGPALLEGFGGTFVIFF